MLTLSAPVYCYLELTSECNLNCPGCGNIFVADKATRPTPTEPRLTLADWQDILLRLKPYIYRLRMTGGECTLHPQFEAIVGFIQELDIPFTVFSNGCWEEPARLVAFLKKVPQFQSFLISLHGATSETHQAFCGVSDVFERITDNIRRAVQAGHSVNTSTVITKFNYAEIEDIVHLSISLGARTAVFNRYVGATADNIVPTKSQLREAIRRIELLKAAGVKVKISTCVPQCFIPNSSRGCLAGNAFWTIDPWGDVRPCNHAPLTCGNLRRQSIENIVHGEWMRRWHDLVPRQCYDCAAFRQCHGGCRAQAMLLECEQEDLMGNPIEQWPNESLQELVLYAGARPVSRFAMRSEPFGYLLIQGNQLTPVSHQAKAILEACDGQTTLRAIQERFGPKAVSFVGSLYRKGLVELRDV